ncbi:GerAB/ArcD/ProY family transporter [Brevibacillus dissolubilis]|uniref:GerAB/ArcD/ProY family transporter n=1 Tax=Brevibacillus dissolubilis TaxID=1844116 RepID=UPI001115DE26|nr:GerAB/ArcD/ProY family transporter [Brevibacillus dissolubilis]
MWMGSRYYFYLILLNGFVNVLLFVPGILIDKRYDGALMAIIVAIPIGVTLIYLFVKLISHFPGEGLPEILDRVLPKKVTAMILIYLATAWFLAGAVTLLAFVMITNRYIDPDVDEKIIMLVFVLVVCYVMRMPSSSILYGLEILLAINLPFVAFILLKAVLNNQVHWDSIIEVGTHLFKMPSYELVATATFIFSGYLNLVIFHRVFGEGFAPKYLSIITLMGSMTLLSSFFVPIGFHGTMGVDDYTIPWVATAGAMRLEFFIVERVLYLFLLVYVMVALVSTMVHWNVALELIKSTLVLTNKDRHLKLWRWGIIGGFAAIMLAMEMVIGEPQVYGLARLFLNSRFATEFLIVGLLIYAVRRKKRHE